MGKLKEEFERRAAVLSNMDYSEGRVRLSGFWDWLQGNAQAKSIVDALKNDTNLNDLVSRAGEPPAAASLESIARVGIEVVERCKSGKEVFAIANVLHIEPRYSSSRLQDYADEVVDRYVMPLLNYLELRIIRIETGRPAPLYVELSYRRALAERAHFAEAHLRIGGLLTWLEEQDVTSRHLQRRRREADGHQLLAATGYRQPPLAATPEEIIAVGIALMEKCREGVFVPQLSQKHGIAPASSSSGYQDYTIALIHRFIEPALQDVQDHLDSSTYEDDSQSVGSYTPPEISNSLALFRQDHPDPTRCAFIMMQFGMTKAHDAIVSSLVECLARNGIAGLRADSKQYHDDLFPNVLTYAYGCAFGIAVFERIEQERFNPNVSLEVGYMMALTKPVCILKDRTLTTLPTDLIGKMYRSFDTSEVAATLPRELEKWLRDKELVP